MYVYVCAQREDTISLSVLLAVLECAALAKSNISKDIQLAVMASALLEELGCASLARTSARCEKWAEKMRFHVRWLSGRALLGAPSLAPCPVFDRAEQNSKSFVRSCSFAQRGAAGMPPPHPLTPPWSWREGRAPGSLFTAVLFSKVVVMMDPWHRLGTRETAVQTDPRQVAGKS